MQWEPDQFERGKALALKNTVVGVLKRRSPRKASRSAGIEQVLRPMGGFMSVKRPFRHDEHSVAQTESLQEPSFAVCLPARLRLYCQLVPATASNQEAYRMGRAFAGHYMAYVAEHPCHAEDSLLARMAEHADFTAEGLEGEYWAGFFSLIEEAVLNAVELLDADGKTGGSIH
ncbi:hypothetical protein NK214_13670 [Chromobacterium sp. S0633]|uniref:hypothetical protein n=1 Tax=Chromobacterium sp. S0633 TaxID=2957805 RepID=UPI00209E3B67|nr:hypothetical protein [Chromobacterium sp. S0633]MCP1291243.1 hypothetical protein [Chromobacterium sp. S0633]